MKSSAPLLVVLLPVWGGMSIGFVLLIGVLLINAGGSSRIPLVETQQEAYHLFTAVPPLGAVLGQQISTGDLRVIKLQAFLDHYRSPMPAQPFIDAADKHDLP